MPTSAVFNNFPKLNLQNAVTIETRSARHLTVPYKLYNSWQFSFFLSGITSFWHLTATFPVHRYVHVSSGNPRYAIDTRLDRRGTCHCDTFVPLWFEEMGNINIGDFGRSYIIVLMTSVLHVRIISVYRRLVTREKYKLRHDPRTTQNDNDKLRKLPTDRISLHRTLNLVTRWY